MAGQNQTVRDHVHLALAHEQNTAVVRERRKKTRYPYPSPIYLTPVEDGVTKIDKTFVVFGRHLSECGLDFYHNEPIPNRQVIVSLPNGDDGWLGLVLELTWCQFNRHGWYNNGGRFLGVATSPLEGTVKQPRLTCFDPSFPVTSHLQQSEL